MGIDLLDFFCHNCHAQQILNYGPKFRLLRTAPNAESASFFDDLMSHNFAGPDTVDDLFYGAVIARHHNFLVGAHTTHLFLQIVVEQFGPKVILISLEIFDPVIEARHSSPRQHSVVVQHTTRRVLMQQQHQLQVVLGKLACNHLRLTLQLFVDSAL